MEVGEAWGMNVPYKISVSCCSIMRPWMRTPLNVTLQALVRVVLQIVTNGDAKLAIKLNLFWNWKVAGSNTASVLPSKRWNSDAVRPGRSLQILSKSEFTTIGPQDITHSFIFPLPSAPFWCNTPYVVQVFSWRSPTKLDIYIFASLHACYITCPSQHHILK